METMNPAMGPATPMSRRVLLSGIGSLMDITAPMVPRGRMGLGGSGMKKGRDAATPCLFEAK